MNQDQRPRIWWKDHWPIAVLIAIALVVFLTGLLGYWRSWTRPFWDWLELLIIPIVLGAGAFWFNNQSKKSEQAIAQDRSQEEDLQRYLDRIQELLLDRGLKSSTRDTE